MTVSDDTQFFTVNNNAGSRQQPHSYCRSTLTIPQTSLLSGLATLYQSSSFFRKDQAQQEQAQQEQAQQEQAQQEQAQQEQAQQEQAPTPG
jgi:hypothetical protein